MEHHHDYHDAVQPQALPSGAGHDQEGHTMTTTDSSGASTTPTTGTPGQDQTARRASLEAMLHQNRANERALFDLIAADRQIEAQAISRSVNADAGAELSKTLHLILRRIGESRKTGEFLAARWVYGHPPGLALEDLEQARTEAEPGESVSVLYLPRPDAHNLQERKAWLVVDVSREVWG